jgi:transposase
VKHVAGPAKAGEAECAIWIDAVSPPGRGSNPFYERPKELLDRRGFGRLAEEASAEVYSQTGRPGFAPGSFFRLLMVGSFEERHYAQMCSRLRSAPRNQ